MKKVTLAIILLCCTLSLAAQNAIRVNYKSEKPSISDFAWAYLSIEDDEEECCVDESTNALKQAWIRHRKGLPQQKNEKLTIDNKNGYILYESRYEGHVQKIEMCYWNEADGKHKLFAYNVGCYQNGTYSPGQFDGLTFYRYNNATKQMTPCGDVGFEVAYGTDDGAYVSYSLPQTGKNIVQTTWYKTGKKQDILKWNGRKFAK